MGKSLKFKHELLEKEKLEFWLKSKQRSEVYRSKKPYSKKSTSWKDIINDITCIKRLELTNQSYSYIHDPERWKPKCYNIEKQKIELVRYLYCKYTVPSFLFDVVINPRRYGINHSTYALWIILLGRGVSLRHHYKDFCMTKRELHLFLNSSNMFDIAKNIWWAKCKALNINDKMINTLLRYTPIVGNEHNVFWEKVILFFSKYNVDKDILSDILDYFRNIPDKNVFLFKGRTLNSIIALSNEWHHEVVHDQIIEKDARFSWNGLGLRDWTYVDKIENSSDLYNITELLTYNLLKQESARMRHCVSSYSYTCYKGEAFIFSMKLNTIRQVTIEVRPEHNSYCVVQVKGKYNRVMTNKLHNIIAKWCRLNKLTGVY